MFASWEAADLLEGAIGGNASERLVELELERGALLTGPERPKQGWAAPQPVLVGAHFGCSRVLRFQPAVEIRALVSNNLQISANFVFLLCIG